MGPLAVLMMSVMNNTQVGRFQLLRYQFILQNGLCFQLFSPSTFIIVSTKCTDTGILVM